jgi:hypothetical protein
VGHTHVVRDAVVELADYALPLCGIGECGQLEGADALPPYLRFPGLGHVERHANEAVGAAPQSRKTCEQERIRPTPPRLEQAVFRLELPGLLPGPAVSAVDQLMVVGVDGLELALVGGSRLDRQPEVAVAACGQLGITTST